jgi:hypothetical protein
MIFRCIIALQLLLLLPALAFNETNTDSAQIDVAPISFRHAVGLVIVAGIVCLCVWFVFKRCSTPKPNSEASAA